MKSVTENNVKIEKGQIYILKSNTKLKGFSQGHRIRIEKYFKDAEEKYKLEGIWLISIKDEGGDWIKPANGKDIMFTQQIEAHFDFEISPMSFKTSRLTDVDE